MFQGLVLNTPSEFFLPEKHYTVLNFVRKTNEFYNHTWVLF